MIDASWHPLPMSHQAARTWSKITGSESICVEAEDEEKKYG